MKRVYIAHPISQGCPKKNFRAATNAFWVLQQEGLAPYCPAWSMASAGEFVEDTLITPAREMVVLEANPNGTDGLDWMRVDLPWVAVSEALLRLPGESRGADLEVFLARQLGIPVFYSTAEVIEWSGKSR